MKYKKANLSKSSVLSMLTVTTNIFIFNRCVLAVSYNTKIFPKLNLKDKGTFSLCLIKHHTMKSYEGVEVQIHVIFILGLDGGEWSASWPSHFTQGERTPGIY
jgi:hypothetical protein